MDLIIFAGYGSCFYATYAIDKIRAQQVTLNENALGASVVLGDGPQVLYILLK